MKKHFAAFLSLLLAVLFCLTLALTACKKDTEPTPDDNTPTTTDVEKKGNLYYNGSEAGGVEVDWNEQVDGDTKRY